MSMLGNYAVPARGAPDFKSQEWVELSGLRLGMHIGSDPCWSDIPTKYWRSWALFWDDMTSQKDAEVRLLSANNEALRTQLQDLRRCLDHALAFWTENNEALKQQTRDLHQSLAQFRNNSTNNEGAQEHRNSFDPSYLSKSDETYFADISTNVSVSNEANLGSKAAPAPDSNNANISASQDNTPALVSFAPFSES